MVSVARLPGAPFQAAISGKSVEWYGENPNPAAQIMAPVAEEKSPTKLGAGREILALVLCRLHLINEQSSRPKDCSDENPRLRLPSLPAPIAGWGLPSPRRARWARAARSMRPARDPASAQLAGVQPVRLDVTKPAEIDKVARRAR